MGAAVSIPLPRLATAAFPLYTSVFFVLAMLFGGGGVQGWSDAVVQLAALPLLAWSLFKRNPSRLDWLGQWAVSLLFASVALPLLQLIPVPPALWVGLPGRDEFASAYEAAGIALPWLPISLDPTSTWLAPLSLLPAAAIFLATLSLDQRSRRVLVMLIFIVVFVSVILDLQQTWEGPDSPLRFYASTNLFRAVGFFANANHNAAFLYSAIPFVAAWAIGLVLDHRRNITIGLVLLALLTVTIIIGLTATQSRTGMALLLVAGLSGPLLAWRHRRDQLGRRLLRLAIAANVVVLLLAFQFGFVAFMQRTEEQGLKDSRWPVARITAQAAIANLPFGSGFGTFVPVYDQFAPRTLLAETYINHAHNDWLELWLTGGVPAIILVVGFLAWFGVATFRLWSQPEAPNILDLALAEAASIVIVLLLLHSVMEFPLRTPTLSVLFAMACAFLIPPRRIEKAAPISREIASNNLSVNSPWPGARYEPQ